MHFLLKMVIFHCYISLPEGTWNILKLWFTGPSCESPANLVCCVVTSEWKMHPTQEKNSQDIFPTTKRTSFSIPIFSCLFSCLWNVHGNTWQHARMSQEDSKWSVNGLFHLVINGIYWDYNPFTNHWSYLPTGHPSGSGLLTFFLAPWSIGMRIAPTFMVWKRF